MDFDRNNLPRRYTVLFNAVEKALEAIGKQNYGIAKTLLVEGQIKAESVFVEESLEQEPPKAGEDTGG